MKLKLTNWRARYSNVFVPKEFKPGDGKFRYGITLLAPKDHADIAAINAEIDRSGTELWKAKAPTILKAVRATGDVCLKDGDLKTADGFAGNFSLAAYNKSAPLVLDAGYQIGADGKPVIDPVTNRPKLRVLTQADGKPYDGCYVDATIDIYAFDKEKNQVNAKLLAVQFRKDGDAFAVGEQASMADFDNLAEGADADDVI